MESVMLFLSGCASGLAVWFIVIGVVNHFKLSRLIANVQHLEVQMDNRTSELQYYIDTVKSSTDLDMRELTLKLDSINSRLSEAHEKDMDELYSYIDTQFKDRELPNHVVINELNKLKDEFLTLRKNL